MTDPLVHAVVVNWNGREYLGTCLQTLLASTYPNLTVVVVDNASEDGSAEMVRREFPRAKVIESGRNLGYAGGANIGIAAGLDEGAEYVLVANNDVEFDPEAIGRLVGAARSEDRAAILGPMIYYYDRRDVIWSIGGEVSFWTGTIRHRGIRETDRGQFDGVTDVDYVTGCVLLASSKAVREIGLLDEGYYMYNEDTDWCERAKRASYRVLAVPEARIWHRISMSSGGGLTSYKIYHRLRSTFRFYRRYARPYHWLGILPVTGGRMLAFAVAQLATGRRGNAAAVFRGLVHSATRRERN